MIIDGLNMYTNSNDNLNIYIRSIIQNITNVCFFYTTNNIAYGCLINTNIYTVTKTTPPFSLYLFSSNFYSN